MYKSTTIFNYLTSKHFYVSLFTFWLFTFVVSLAQESTVTKIDSLQTTSSNIPNSIQVEEGDVKITDGTNTLIRITDEGTFGAIEILPGTPDDSDNKLYNKNGVLSFDGSPVASSGDNDWVISGNNMYSTASGNVGVGLTNPTEKFEVVGKTKTSELQVTTGATDGHILTSDATGNATWQAPSGSALNLSIGDTYEGGIIFWLDVSGEHGLIVHPVNWHQGPWLAPSASANLFANLKSIYTGSINTALVNEVEGSLAGSVFGAVRTNNLSSPSGYNDWYIPSSEELQILIYSSHTNGLGVIDNLVTYWSSTQTTITTCIAIRYYANPTGSSQSISENNRSSPYTVRIIRKF